MLPRSNDCSTSTWRATGSAALGAAAISSKPVSTTCASLRPAPVLLMRRSIGPTGFALRKDIHLQPKHEVVAPCGPDAPVGGWCISRRACGSRVGRRPDRCPAARRAPDDSGGSDRTADTGAAGDFAFPDLPEGDYEISAELTGFERQERAVRVRAGERVTVSFTLRVALVEKTIVTAAKAGGRDVQEIPIAITAVSQADLGRLGTQTIEGAPALAPS